MEQPNEPTAICEQQSQEISVESSVNCIMEGSLSAEAKNVSLVPCAEEESMEQPNEPTAICEEQSQEISVESSVNCIMEGSLSREAENVSLVPCAEEESMEQPNEPTAICEEQSQEISVESSVNCTMEGGLSAEAKNVSLVPYAEEESNEEESTSNTEVTPESSSTVTTVKVPTIENDATFLAYRKPEENNHKESSDSDSDSEFDFPVHGNKSGSEDEHEEKKSKNDPDKAKAFGSVRTKGETTLEDLPPIGELKITIGDNVTLTHLGEILSVVGVLVVVKSKQGLPALDDGTILFNADRKVLGQVFETLGPVVSPFYSLRFNSATEIEEKSLHSGATVFYAPDMTEYTHYVFLSQIQRVRGSDASWENNNEPPPHSIDYSDDEQERSAKRERARQNRNNRQEKSDEEEEEEKEDNEGKPKRFLRKRGRGGRPHDNSRGGQHHDNNRANKPKFPSAEFENPFLKVWPPPNDVQHQWSDNTPRPNSYGFMPEGNSYPPPPPPRFHGYNPNQPPPGYPYQSSTSTYLPPPPPPRDMRYVQNSTPDQPPFPPRQFPPNYGPPQQSQFGQQPRFPDYRLSSPGNNWNAQQ